MSRQPNSGDDAIRAVVRDELIRAKRQIEKEAAEDKAAVNQEIDSLKARIAKLEEEISRLRARGDTAQPTANNRQLVTRDDMRGILTTTLKQTVAAMQKETTELATAQIRKELAPQMTAVREALMTIATQVNYQNTDTSVGTHNYMMGVLHESESDEKRAITDGRAGRTDIIRGAVRVVFDEDDEDI